MSDWPGDTAPLPHARHEDRLGVRLAGMVARPCVCEECSHATCCWCRQPNPYDTTRETR